MVHTQGKLMARATQHDSQAVHDALFPKEEASPPGKSLDALKHGIRAHVKRRHPDKRMPKRAATQQRQTARKP
ncbi:hypothetical protein [Variovorax rhizosphaerae]|uniref:Uncharacterized protein n=1 Tax=Variovorax rhizosphaerae TaxID=1836200 RepID=A0ABU8WEI5_9BURK